MQVVSLAPVPVASLAWRMGDGRWTLSVICKLTLNLEPGEAALAKRHDPIYERDRFPDDDSGASLYATSDLVPTRPFVDVTLVGAAYAPRGGPSQRVAARLHVRTIDKKLHVEGSVNGGFKSAALGYEFADHTDQNPVGGGERPTHRISTVVDPSASNPSYQSPGFGPIAAHWPTRHGLLRGAAEPLPSETGDPLELPAGFDLKFFNAAPADQQLTELQPNAELLLENLHPDHELLRTRLPNVAPQAFIERDGSRRREEATSSITSLWIDTRRSVATLTFHSTLPLRNKDEPGKVWVTVAGPGRRLTLVQLDKLIGTLRGNSEPPEDEQTSDESGEHGDLGRTVSIRASSPRGQRRRAHNISAEETKTSVLSRDGLDTTQTAPGELTAEAKARNDGFPSWVAKGAKSVPPPPPTRGRPGRSSLPRESTVLGLGPETYAAARDDAERHAVTAASPAVPPAAPAPMPVPPPPSLAAAPPAPPSVAAPLTPAPAAAPSVAAAPVSVGAPASVGAPPPSTRLPWPASERADRLEDTSSLPRLDADAALGKVKPARVPNEVTELLWFSNDATPALRRRYKAICERLDFAPRDDQHDLPTEDKALARHHHTHFGVLTEGTCDDAAGLRRALREAISERGRFTPPLVILRGVLRFPFESLDVLRATAAVVKPVIGDDKKLKAALEQVDELLATPLLGGSAETVSNFVTHLRKLYSDSRRALTMSYLDETVERMLLEQRKYQKRTLFGSTWIRALLSLGDNDSGIPAYLPEELDKKLPMMVSFNARAIAEAHVKQDQYETHPHALRVVTLGRAIKVEG